MAMDTQWDELCDRYDQCGDDQLLQMHARRDDLTELAQQALEQVMQERGLTPVAGAAAESPAAEEPELVDTAELDLEPDEAPLWFFTDGLEASAAIDAMVEAMISYRIVNKSEMGSGYPYPGLQMIVSKADVERSQELLRARLGLFPLPEVDLNPTDQYDPMAELTGWVSLGEFARADAVRIASALGESGFSYVWDDGLENSSPTQTASVSVKRHRVKESRREVAARLGSVPNAVG